MSIAWLYLCVCLSFAYKLKCPHESQWAIRARIVCGDPSKYFCLWDGNSKEYKEDCKKAEYENPGRRYEWWGNFDGNYCQKVVYQPYFHWTNESSGCLYKKSLCNEEGQVVYDDTDTKRDAKCTCDYANGYDFITKPNNPCYCLPAEEDCSCYLNPCLKPDLMSDPRCTGMIHIGYKDNCLPIKNNSNEGQKQPILFNKHGNQTDHTLSLPDRQNIPAVMFLICSLISVVVLVVLVVLVKIKIDSIRKENDGRKAEYREHIMTNKEKRLYIRVMIVGKRGVGKSCLLRRLLNEGIEGVKSTDGIEIAVRRCKIRLSDGKWIFDPAQDPKKEYATRIKRALQKQNEQETHQDPSDPSTSDVGRTETNAQSRDTMKRDQQAAGPQEEVKLSERKKDTPLIHHPETIIQERPPNDTQEQENTSQFAETLTETTPTMKVTKVLTDNVERELDHFLSHIEQYEDENEVYVEIGFWDFAGEKEYYGTHHTFLDSNALYLLVTDCSQDLRQMEPSVTFDSIGNYIDFWFDTIHNCRGAEGGTTSTGTQLDPPVIVVGTGLDKLTGKIGEKRNTFRLNLNDAIGDGRKKDHLRQVCFVSNTKPSESDFNHIRNLIFEYGKQVQSFGEELPLKWIRLEQSLDVLRQSECFIIARDDITVLAGKCDIKDTEEVEKFLLHQNKMGSIIYYQDIQNYIILSQQWLADAFKCVVSDSDKIDDDVKMTDEWVSLLKTGILEISLLEKLFEKEQRLKFKEYQDHILQVLMKFDIIGRNNEQGMDIYYMPYMIKSEYSPSLMDIISHFVDDQGHCRKTPWLCYEFEFFPVSFFIYVMLYFIKIYKICFDNNLNKRSIYHGVGVYLLDSTSNDKLIVVFCKSTVAFQIWQWDDFPKNKYRTFLIQVKKVLDKLETKYKAKNLRYYVKVQCSEGDVNSKTGRMSYQDFLQKSRDGQYFCDEHKFKHDSSQLLDTWFYNYENVS